MRDQLEIYKELFNLAEKKTDVLIKGDVKILGEITEIEQDLIIKLGKLEEERYDIVSKIAKKHNIEVNEATTEFFMKLLSSEEKEDFSAICDELKTVLPQINEKNQQNEKLIKNALEYINFSINLLTDTGDIKANYSADGVNTRKDFHFIDKKA